jgi:hypothetical protein
MTNASSVSLTIILHRSFTLHQVICARAQNRLPLLFATAGAAYELSKRYLAKMPPFQFLTNLRIAICRTSLQNRPYTAK